MKVICIKLNYAISKLALIIDCEDIKNVGKKFRLRT